MSEQNITINQEFFVQLAEVLQNGKVIAVTGCGTEKCTVHLFEVSDHDGRFLHHQVPCGVIPFDQTESKIDWAAQIDWSNTNSSTLITDVSCGYADSEKPNGKITKGMTVTVFPLAGNPVEFPVVCQLAILTK